jgi:hypothetical protein
MPANEHGKSNLIVLGSITQHEFVIRQHVSLLGRIQRAQVSQDQVQRLGSHVPGAP